LTLGFLATPPGAKLAFFVGGLFIMRIASFELTVRGQCYIILSALCLASASAGAAEAITKPVMTSWRLADETYKLPQGERMGMTSATMLFDVTGNVRLGAATYAATRGTRGGFITLGAAAEWREPLSRGWGTHAGLFVGAGGGRNGAAVAGGGLMLRGDLGLTYDMANWGRIGVGVSHVKFPSGVISSTQPYVMLEHTFYTAVADGWVPEQATGLKLASTLTMREQEAGPTYRYYKIPASVVQDNGQPQYPSIGLMGFAWQGYLDDNWFIKMEAEGAMGGRSDGYMQLFGGGGYRWSLLPGTDLKLFGAIGAGGGGKVDTGGGFMLDGGIALRQRLTEKVGLEFTLAHVAAPSRSFKATSAGVQLSYRFATPLLDGGRVLTGKEVMGLDPEHVRVRFAEQTYFDNSANWRSSNQALNVSNLGMQFDYFISPNWFLSGQGLAAYSGKAGSYMKGLVGIGAHLPLTKSIFVEGEALVGAAGGGGLSVGGGLVTQANASLGYQLSKSLAVMATMGRFDATKGNMTSKVAGVSLAYQMSVLTAP
jgi:hypothetical protein